jgi:predicted RNase H-like nuclease (RuvC/YqgF family)
MVEPIMFFGIGFLFAALIGLIIIPLVQARAVRLTMRRLEAATPLSMAEIQADKDQLRAEFAMSTRRLEMSVEQMKAKTTSQLAELGKKSDAINRLKMELGEKTATIFALEARDRALKDQLRATEEELSFKLNAMREAERALTEKQEDLARLTGKLDQQSVVNDSQRIELVALRTQVDALKDHVSDTEREFKTTEDRLDRERFDAAEASDLLNAERSKVSNLADRVSDLEHQLIAQTKEAEILGRRAQELETRFSDQARLLAERDYQCNELKSRLEGMRTTEADLRAQLAGIGGSRRSEIESLKGEKAALERELYRALEEQAALRREMASVKRDTEASWASERVESALLRERINDVAAEVARLTAALEGPGSPIETILAGEAPSVSVGGERTAPNIEGGAEGENKGSLAERIRALQSRVTQISSQKPN